MDISIIICTRDRAGSLAQTLDSFRTVDLPEEWTAELLLMDDGSRDHTAEVARGADLGRITVRYLSTAGAGKCAALNLALAEAVGQALLFTDDDARVPAEWVREMAGPILADEVDALAGPVRLDPGLRRDWMDQTLDVWLAAGTPPVGDMWGVNMAIHRRVLERVPGFDPHLGPGMLGYAEDSLFSRLVERAGCRMAVCSTTVNHFPDASRLNEASLVRAAGRRGRSSAYVAHHLNDAPPQWPRLQLLLLRAKSALRSAWTRPCINPRRWLLFYTWHIHFLEEHLNLRGTPVRYSPGASPKEGWPPASQQPSTAL